jgi:hypothetical protein
VADRKHAATSGVATTGATRRVTDATAVFAALAFLTAPAELPADAARLNRGAVEAFSVATAPVGAALGITTGATAIDAILVGLADVAASAAGAAGEEGGPGQTGLASAAAGRARRPVATAARFDTHPVAADSFWTADDTIDTADTAFVVVHPRPAGTERIAATVTGVRPTTPPLTSAHLVDAEEVVVLAVSTESPP